MVNVKVLIKLCISKFMNPLGSFHVNPTNCPAPTLQSVLIFGVF